MASPRVCFVRFTTAVAKVGVAITLLLGHVKFLCILCISKLTFIALAVEYRQVFNIQCSIIVFVEGKSEKKSLLIVDGRQHFKNSRNGSYHRKFLEPLFYNIVVSSVHGFVKCSRTQEVISGCWSMII